MNQFRQLFLGALLLFVGTSLSAQSFAVKGGLNLANVSFSDDSGLLEGEDTDTDTRTTFHIGATADFPLGNVLSFQTGLIYQNRGFSQEYSETVDGVMANAKISQQVAYLDIPLTLKANFDLGSLGAYVYGGGYVGIGLAGELEIELDSPVFSFSDSEDLEFGEDGDVNRLDYGALIGAGVEFNSIFVEVSYGLGLANLIPDPIDDESAKNRLLSLSVGYRFN
jgi:hypothetical protein